MIRFRKKLNIFRHGDLLIREVTTIPSNATPLSTNIIAMGEKSGHNHKLYGKHQVWETLERGLPGAERIPKPVGVVFKLSRGSLPYSAV